MRQHLQVELLRFVRANQPIGYRSRRVGFGVVEVCFVSAGWMGRRVAPTRADPTRRPQVLGRLRLVFGPPARLHVWALLSRPKQNHRSGAANVLRSRRSFTQPQSSEVIERVPLPSTWHCAWELSFPFSQHPYFLSSLRFQALRCSPPIPNALERRGSDMLAPHHPSISWFSREVREHMVTISQSHITNLSTS